MIPFTVYGGPSDGDESILDKSKEGPTSPPTNIVSSSYGKFYTPRRDIRKYLEENKGNRAAMGERSS